MADHNAPSMDYAEHERTYNGFINFSKVGTIASLNVMLCLILFTFGGGAGTFFGWVALIATLAAAAVGLATGAKGWIPSAVVFLVTGLLAIVTAA
ncbi:aa3-type cytochrome c oxidase subunit IV [Stappia indica]|uniref:Aa3 type cytochrome c oxidase subunit IV n=1 Tax=Stappia indica TaxID=538381 RepID=A0A285TH73_9HYPH|nr:aa3-type cytochrome c oxidase subunit IV [Stappia indica]MCC4245416.1 aa3-type cytochrome c oxidase subunit IV [Stappia indica]SOC21530.1 aa3 type cytochrome c oxidase subunit IV [Stappia indica]